MNDTMIENILLQAPRPVAPADLLKTLKAEIALPAKKMITGSREWRSPLRRWFPALAFGVLMLSCAIMIAVQTNWGTNLKRQNEALRAAAAELPQLREQHAAIEKAQAQQDELAQLRKDNQEMHQLQTEVTQLRNLSAQIQRLQNENRQLSAAPAPNTNATSGSDFFDQGQMDAERIQCVNNLKQVGLAFRIWAGDNTNKYPTSLVVMSNELSTTKILVCPSDKARQPFASLGFGQFQDNMTSYQFTVKPDDENYPECIIARCPIHHNYLLADGSVQQIDPEKVVIAQKDGRWYLEAVQPGATYQGRIIQTIK
jgi:hypothetical protein